MFNNFGVTALSEIARTDLNEQVDMKVWKQVWHPVTDKFLDLRNHIRDQMLEEAMNEGS